MAASNSILQKAQQAAREYIRTAAFVAATVDLQDETKWLLSESIQSGISQGPATESEDSEKNSTPLPSVVCKFQNAQAQASGCWRGELSIELRANAHDTEEDTFLAYWGQICDLFIDDQDAALVGLSALADFTALHFNITNQQYDIVDDSWRASLSIELRCIGKDVS